MLVNRMAILILQFLILTNNAGRSHYCGLALAERERARLAKRFYQQHSQQLVSCGRLLCAVSDVMTSSSKLFQWMIVLGKKEFL